MKNRVKFSFLSQITNFCLTVKKNALILDIKCRNKCM